MKAGSSMNSVVGSKKSLQYLPLRLPTSDFNKINKIVLVIGMNILLLPLDIAGWSSGSSLGS